jgi:hypothetical protein
LLQNSVVETVKSEVMVMARVSPQDAAAKWARRLSGATEDIRAGVQRVNVAPTQLAAQSADKMLAKVTEAVQNGKWQDGLQRVSLAQWQSAVLTKGLPRIAQGAQAGQSRMAQFMSEFLPYLDQGVSQVKNMPNMTVEDGIQRAAAMIRWNSQFRRRG